MTLAATYVESEMALGKKTNQIITELSKATGYKIDHSTLFRWKNGERNPRPEVRAYMLKKALPYALARHAERSSAGLTPLVEALL